MKTLSDPDRDRVSLDPVKATVESLTTLRLGRAPGGARYAPVELTVYQVEAYLAAAYPENDGDWHVVLFDLQNQRVSLIAEIPDSRCSGAYDSGFAEQYDRARQALAAVLATPNPQDAPIRVRVTGVGFFDREHGQAGAAPNKFELHPVLKFELVK